jgi:hypothetical protein
MPWCLECRTEYRDGFATCSDCGAALVDELPPTEAVTPDFDHETFLISVGDKMEAEVLEAKLKSCGIPVLRKYRETGGYLNIYMGMTSLGIDLYVPSRLLKDAKDVLETGKEDKAAVDGEMEEIEDRFRKGRRVKAWIILLLFVPGFIWAIIAIIKAILLNYFYIR